MRTHNIFIVIAAALFITACGDSDKKLPGQEAITEAAEATEAAAEATEAAKATTEAAAEATEAAEATAEAAEATAEAAEATTEAAEATAEATEATETAADMMDKANEMVAETMSDETSMTKAAPATSTASAETLASGKKVYESSCQACHATGAAGAPKLGDTANWAPRIAAGMDSMSNHAINGYQGSQGFMPPKGGFTNLSDDEVKAAVAYMASASK